MIEKISKILLVLALTGCTNESGARNALENQGFTDIYITGYEPFSCSDSDGTSTGFSAKNPKGKQVSGVVCCGRFFKNCTIRW